MLIDECKYVQLSVFLYNNSNENKTCIVGNSPGCPIYILNPFPFPSTLPKLS